MPHRIEIQNFNTLRLVLDWQDKVQPSDECSKNRDELTSMPVEF